MHVQVRAVLEQDSLDLEKLQALLHDVEKRKSAARESLATASMLSAGYTGGVQETFRTIILASLQRSWEALEEIGVVGELERELSEFLQTHAAGVLASSSASVASNTDQGGEGGGGGGSPALTSMAVTSCVLHMSQMALSAMIKAGTWDVLLCLCVAPGQRSAPPLPGTSPNATCTPVASKTEQQQRFGSTVQQVQEGGDQEEGEDQEEAYSADENGSEGEALFTGVLLNTLSLRALQRDGWQIHYQKPYNTVTREAELKPAKKCKWLMVAAREISSDTLMIAAMASAAQVGVLLCSLSHTLSPSLSLKTGFVCLSSSPLICMHTHMYACVCIYLYACTHTCIQTGTQTYQRSYRSAPGEWSLLLSAPWKLLRVLQESQSECEPA